MVALCSGGKVMAAPGAVLEPAAWTSQHLVDHPLVGTLWNGETRKAAVWSQLQQRLRRARFVMIGEIHTNPDHHRWQAAAIDFLGQAGRSPAIVWEMIPTTRQHLLNTWLSGEAADTDELARLGKALNWSASGWPAWTLYQPIAGAAGQYRMPMFGAAFERAQVRQIGQEGMSGYSRLQKARLGLDKALTESNREAMLGTLRAGHCNLMPLAALQPMLQVQRARDGQMAAIMQQAATIDGAVLIAGNGHVRKDWAVPAVLRGKGVVGPLLSIAQIEVEAGKTKATDYEALGSAPHRYDFVLFTPRANNTDHCAELRQRMKARPQ